VSLALQSWGGVASVEAKSISRLLVFRDDIDNGTAQPH